MRVSPAPQKPARTAAAYGEAWLEFDELSLDRAALDRALAELQPRLARDPRGPLRRVVAAMTKAKGQIKRQAASLARDIQKHWPDDARMRDLAKRWR